MDKDKLDDKRIDFLISLYGDLREELRQRISQRDSFAIQFMVSIGAIVALSIQENSYASFLFLLLPAITLFFSIQIFYSYSIHRKLSDFIREHVESELSRLLEYKQGQMQNIFWENRCKYDRMMEIIKSPGIRESFFKKLVLIMPSISLILNLVVASEAISEDKLNISYVLLYIISVSITILYFVAAVYLLKRVSKPSKMYNLLGEVDYINPEYSNKTSNCSFKKNTIFIDRDGTINVDTVKPHKIEDLTVIPEAIDFLRTFSDKGYNIVIVTNQDGIGNNEYSVRDMHNFNMELLEILKKNSIEVDLILYSPYKKEDNHYSFKPNPGMIYLAQEIIRFDFENAWFIGDQISDIKASLNAGIKPILVTTGIYKDIDKTILEAKRLDVPICQNLIDAIKIID